MINSPQDPVQRESVQLKEMPLKRVGRIRNKPWPEITLFSYGCVACLPWPVTILSRQPNLFDVSQSAEVKQITEIAVLMIVNPLVHRGIAFDLRPVQPDCCASPQRGSEDT